METVERARNSGQFRARWDVFAATLFLVEGNCDRAYLCKCLSSWPCFVPYCYSIYMNTTWAIMYHSEQSIHKLYHQEMYLFPRPWPTNILWNWKYVSLETSNNFNPIFHLIFFRFPKVQGECHGSDLGLGEGDTGIFIQSAYLSLFLFANPVIVCSPPPLFPIAAC